MNHDLAENEVSLAYLLYSLWRRKILIIASALTGALVSCGIVFLSPKSTPPVSANMILDLSVFPKLCTKIKSSEFGNLDTCYGLSRDTAWTWIESLLSSAFSKDEILSYSVNISAATMEPRVKSENIIEISTLVPPAIAPIVSRKLQAVANDFQAKVKNYYKEYGNDSRIERVLPYSTQWKSIIIEKPSMVKSFPVKKILVGLSFGLISGIFLSWLADSRSGIAYSLDKIISELRYPVILTLPSYPWINVSVDPLIGQLCDQFCDEIEWRVVSIAKNHSAVSYLANSLKCSCGEPLLTSVLLPPSEKKSLGIFLVVEPGFNTIQALKTVNLSLKNLPYISKVYLIVLGSPIAAELLAT